MYDRRIFSRRGDHQPADILILIVDYIYYVKKKSGFKGPDKDIHKLIGRYWYEIIKK